MMRLLCRLGRHKWLHIVNFIDFAGGVHLTHFDKCRYCHRTRLTPDMEVDDGV